MSESPEDPGWNRASPGWRSWLDPERRNAVIGLAALFLVAGAIVGAAIIFTDPPQPPSVNGVSALDDTTTPAEDPDGSDEDVASDDDANEGLMEPEGADEVDDGFEEAVEESPEAASIDFDGVCSVTLAGTEGTEEAGDEEAAEEDRADAEVPDEPRPWHFEECTSAPVELADSEEQRWIVVLASLPRNEYDEAAARERADELGFDDQVLYSSHYPSLNPDLWVVYDGPFAHDDEARAAAADHGGGAYPRVLADEGGDRY